MYVCHESLFTYFTGGVSATFLSFLIDVNSIQSNEPIKPLLL